MEQVVQRQMRRQCVSIAEIEERKAKMLHEYMVIGKHWEKHKTSQETKSHEKKSCHRSKTSPQGANRNRYHLQPNASLNAAVNCALQHVRQNQCSHIHSTK